MKVPFPFVESNLTIQERKRSRTDGRNERRGGDHGVFEYYYQGNVSGDEKKTLQDTVVTGTLYR